VLLVPQHVLAFDPEEFRALARTVRATLLSVEDNVNDVDLEARLLIEITAAADMRATR
jgi:hypothetical protein